MAADASQTTQGPAEPGDVSPFNTPQWKIKGKYFSNSFHVEDGLLKAFEFHF